MGKDGDRRSDEDHREDDTAVTIDVLSAFRLAIALQNCRYQNLDQRKEDETRAGQDEDIQTRHVREPW